ncbi:hypothetical protein KO527_05090 [Pseudoalteromonas sp. C2R02]|jgi:hypothetical protein|uniref:hypothetical protein n=1 Tax=Pseudoalteromonas sp. C2R02 TaxID=2841565 RepID=UPI001C08CB7E|nr:hypothetical protein [Pseudoalteromonas sp. C2R02]MBU2968722.1 hypothetical protein [Pseudoalteromonas sp. C2R02]
MDERVLSVLEDLHSANLESVGKVGELSALIPKIHNNANYADDYTSILESLANIKSCYLRMKQTTEIEIKASKI